MIKKVQQIVFTAATLVALSGLAYSENTGSSIYEQVDTGISADSNIDGSAGGATGSGTDTGTENPPGTGGDIERGDYPGGSPGGIMENYSSATNGDSSVPPSEGDEGANP
ncbi:MAG: hypothetical protein A2X79_02710 [Desulfuromonadaceae bacterium GWB2_53_15]|nr:MAG: hypothetical protein A2X83_04120 [Desulfuromonadales bacterium GWD2_54_10]OHB31720.1 MAG: hypothetical protein A2X79_02710 [Desulfuromonadaceae bacterium GWB2_53_15]